MISSGQCIADASGYRVSEYQLFVSKTIASVQAYIRTYAPASDLEVQHVHAFLSFLQVR